MAPLLLLLLLLPVQLLLAVANAVPDSCTKATCACQDIHYPFWLNSSAPDCGYAGIGLLCEDNSTLILPFKSHRYIVSSIDYKTHTVLVSDADIADEYAAGCPRLHVNLTIDTVWLRLAPSASNITFLYSCKRNITLSSAVELSGCQPQQQDGNRSYVLRDGGITGAEAYEFECEEVVVAPVLDVHKKAVVGAPGGPPPENGSFREVLQGGFELNYDTHNHQCDRCEGSGGWCGYQRNETHVGGLTFTCFCEGGRTTDRCVTGSKRKTPIIAGTLSLLFLCLVILKFFSASKDGLLPFKSKDEPRVESFLQKNGNLHPKRYTYADVKRMTKSFTVKLGQGGFGAVYGGKLYDGRQVAVKMLKDTKGDGEEFMNEVASISRTSHVNVVSLLGFCIHGSKRALIYEYMPNGSLERYAFNSNMNSGNSLSWEKLFGIAIGTARGLEYLHRGCNTRIVHFDIKPHNILLDQDFCPKISDFGLAKLCLNKESAISIAGARGTIGYIAPEVYSKQFGIISSKSDVYSYGMMVLEMVGARDRNTSGNSESSSQYFPQWIYEHLDDYCISASEINGEMTELVRKMIVVSLWCIQVIPTDRPTMTRVVEMLDGSTSNLELPPKVYLS
ncbi:LEAF RUST 10 DISEASE-RESISTANCEUS RECEPTOR-LIKE PROTEIN KINASE-like 2.1 isoform X2 [Miscanthus floridulus]|uniref:LEAF RUST 10 DISEASE-RESISTANCEUS RECEPTOR-LIKE PROTEIN KINASE-like 2.1 isoform X2 n=1 Tax=Miscanthus floridulus TaxID=154761 RepID=UPI00345A39EF